MSYEKVKRITRKIKEGKIFITSADSSIQPLTYRTWEYCSSQSDYHKKELSLIMDINHGNFHLNNSLYNWNYALYIADEEIKKIYNTNDWWEFSDMHYQTYCLGEKLTSTDIPITQEELNTGKYTLEWESKDGEIKTYYNTEEYQKEEKRVNEAWEKYYEIFMQNLNQKFERKYYLHSDTYGNIKPIGTNGAFYYDISLREKDFMDYKKAYCLKVAIGRDVKIVPVPKREYEPTKEQIEESKTRIKMLGLEPKYGESLYESTCFRVEKIDFRVSALAKVINDFETTHKAYVYHVVYKNTDFGEMYNLLYVSNYKEEWENDRKDIENNMCYAYAYNATYPEDSEMGIIGIELNNGVLRRTF